MERDNKKVVLNGSYGQMPLPLFPSNPALAARVKNSADIADSGPGGRIPVVTIPLVLATSQSLADYAELYEKEGFDKVPVRIKQWPGIGCRYVLGGTSGGVTEGAFTAVWDSKGRCQVKTDSVGQSYNIGWRHKNDIFLQDANYHPDGSQVFQSLDGDPFILVLSKHQDDETIAPTHFVAFYVSGTQTVNLYAGTWHQAAFPVKAESRLYTKQGKVFEESYSVDWDEAEERVSRRDLLVVRGKQYQDAAVIHLLSGKTQELIVDRLETRIDGARVLFPQENKAYLICLVKSRAGTEEPDWPTLKVFKVPGNRGLEIAMSVWASVGVPLDGTRKLPFMERSSAVRARKVLPLSEEKIPPIRIPLSPSAPA